MRKIFALFLLLVSLIIFSPTNSYSATGSALSDEGATYLLDIIFQDVAVESFKLALYCTDISPADTDTYSTYTWCTGTVGEAPKTLTRGASWTLSGSAPAQAQFTQQDFSFSGDLTTNGTIYGYCITNNAGDKLIGCEALTSSFTPHSGYHLYITPTVKLSKGTPN